MRLAQSLKIAGAAIALGVMPCIAAAQTQPAPAVSSSAAPDVPPTAGHHGHHHHASLMHALRTVNLTDAQKQQIKTFVSAQRQANQTADPATKHANAAKLHDQIMTVLTPDQKTQLASELARERAQHNAMAPNPAATPAPQ